MLLPNTPFTDSDYQTVFFSKWLGCLELMPQRKNISKLYDTCACTDLLSFFILSRTVQVASIKYNLGRILAQLGRLEVSRFFWLDSSLLI